MEAIKSVVVFCGLLGILILCLLLIVSAVLRWLKPSNTRAKRLNVMALLAVLVLGILFLIYSQENMGVLFADEASNASATTIVVNTSKAFIKLLIFGAIALSAVMLVFVVLLIAYHTVDAFIQAQKNGGLKDKLQKKSTDLTDIMKTPIVVLVITGGVLAVFLILPLLMGKSTTGSLAVTWETGVRQIVEFVDSEEAGDADQDNTSEENETPDGNELPEGSENPDKGADDFSGGSAKADVQSPSPFYKILLKYILIYIIVFGIGFAALKILYNIIKNAFTSESSNGFLGEYSSSIGVLAVGISLLLSIQSVDIDVFKDNPTRMIGEFVKSFVIVIFIVALSVLTLEIIRLIIDMRETLIRQESKYLFISLVGQVSMLLLEVIHSLYQAVSSIIGFKTNDEIENIQESLKEEMTKAAQEEMKDKKDFKLVFSGFDKKVTKK